MKNTPVYKHSTVQTIVSRHILISANVLRADPILLMSKLTSYSLGSPFARSRSLLVEIQFNA